LKFDFILFFFTGKIFVLDEKKKALEAAEAHAKAAQEAAKQVEDVNPN